CVFSSRRRHTRFKCDWSSDVCSSDLLFLCERNAVLQGKIAFESCNSVFVGKTKYFLFGGARSEARLERQMILVRPSTHTTTTRHPLHRDNQHTPTHTHTHTHKCICVLSLSLTHTHTHTHTENTTTRTHALSLSRSLSLSLSLFTVD